MSTVKELTQVLSEPQPTAEEDARQVLMEAEQARMSAFNEELRALLQKHRFALRPEITLGPTGVVRASVLVVPA